VMCYTASWHIRQKTAGVRGNKKDYEVI
jgi:hypothetical protein